MANPLIWAASQIWSAGSAIARLTALSGVRESKKLPCRVISVGNIQVGGAGKTPLVAQIAREAHDRGLSVCILSRGYRGKWEQSGGVIRPSEPVKASDCGDECALLHIVAPEAFIGVGADRAKQFEKVIQAGASIDLVILDDGFQNWRIRKDLEIVALTSATSSKVLHRDWPSALDRADLLVWTKGQSAPEIEDSAAPLVKVRFALPHARAKSPVWLVAGVADGNSVLNAARTAGYHVKNAEFFGDHAQYTQAQVQSFMSRSAKDGVRIALTGKDWVKWRDLGVREEEVIILEPVVEFISGREHWVKALWGNE